jgi:Tfp pilus assembly protein PilF
MLLCAATVVAVPLVAQEKPPERPKLPADADTLDAEAYFDYGTRPDVDWKKTHAAFYWASRLDPEDIGYVRAIAVALLNRQSPQWRDAYDERADFVAKSKEAKRIDSAFAEVYVRQPFTSGSTACYLTEGLEKQRDRLLVGIVNFNRGCYAQAIDAYKEALAKDSSLLGVHMDMARANYYLHHYDQAVVELQVVLDSLRARDAKYLFRFYESKAMFEYMIGMVYLRARQPGPAREAFGRALTEDLSFYSAHVRLGDIASDEGKVQTAATEYGLAAELKPEDGSVHYYQGEALVRLHMFDQAEQPLREAIRLEPYWAQPYFQLGLALEGQGKPAEAIDAFEDFLARCPRRLHVQADQARAHEKAAKEKIAGSGGDGIRLP